MGVQHCAGPVPPAPAPLRRALAKAPWDRPDSAIELAAALRSEATRGRARRIGIGVALAMVAIVVGAVQFRAIYETRLAQQRAKAAEHEASATALTSELEQGRAALLHDDLAEARRHLGEAWRRGDHSRTTEFMLARAEQPLRAELARLDGHGRMWSASWSPDGRQIATSDDAGAQIWDASTYARLATLSHGDVVYAAVWTVTGRLVTACGDGAVRIWSGGHLMRELRLQGRSPRWYALAVSPDGRQVAAVDAKGAAAAVWDAGTGAVLAEIPLGGAGAPLVAFSANGRWLAVSGGDAAEILDAVTWHRALGVGEQVRAIAWDPTGPRLLTGGADGDASLWTIPDGARQPHQFSEAVTAVAFAPDGSRAAIGGGDGAEQFIDTSTGRIVAHGNYLHASVVSLAFSADAQRIAATGASGVLTIGDAASSLPVGTIESPGRRLWSASFGPAGRVLAASWNGAARVWEARPSVSYTHLRAHETPEHLVCRLLLEKK